MKKGQIVNHVRLVDQVPEFYSVKPTDIDELANILDKKKGKINYHRSKTLQGNIINIEPSPQMWLSLEDYTYNGGKIQSIKVIDTLERMIEEVSK